MIYYETEMEAQRAIKEINRYKGWRAEKYIAIYTHILYIQEYGIVKSIKIKELQIGQKKQVMVCFSKERETQEAITEIKRYEGWNVEVYRNVYNKKGLAKFQAGMKINRNKTQTEKRKKKEIQKRIRKNEK